MADVRPFRGIRYAPEVVSDLGQVLCPPFDVISPEAQERYYARHPYNMIRLELGREFPDDTSLNNRYTRAAQTFAEWRREGVLRQDPVPSYYLYQQRFSYGGQSYTRTGLVARVRLEPWSARVVLPHELTLSKPKDDRLQLMRACAANFSPIMAWYEDPQARLRRLLQPYAERAEVQVRDELADEHRLHPITDPQQIALIQDFFSQRQLFIADGHHRYETALSYREEIRELHRGLDPEDGANFVMMVLIDVDDPGLLVLPTHRLLSGLSAEQLQRLSPTHLSRYFQVEHLEGESGRGAALVRRLAEAGRAAPAFALLTNEGSWLLTLTEAGRARMAESGRAPAWNALDVAIAHRLLLEELLGLSAEDVSAGRYLRYTHETEEALAALPRGEAQAVLLLNPTPVRQVCEVARADERMPQKSTYLYPKLASGLVIHPLW
uniref:Phosphatase n=1 Tax=Thermogemmatispora argillosa TaxID=2045280 RepID=A0A455T6N3_9CHLR|nr:phosphatase [Thermogemmatispora argillosa]